MSDIEAIPEVRSEFHRLNSLAARPALNLVTHTRQVEPHQAVTVELADGTLMNSVVLRAADDALYLALPIGQHLVRFEPGQPLNVTFWRPLDARYQFEGRVIGHDGHSASRWLWRTLRWSASSSASIRESIAGKSYQLGRLTREQFSNFGKLPQPPQLPVKGRLHDLSVGGACFTTPMALTKNGWVALSLGAHESGEPSCFPERCCGRRGSAGRQNPCGGPRSIHDSLAAARAPGEEPRGGN